MSTSGAVKLAFVEFGLVNFTGPVHSHLSIVPSGSVLRLPSNFTRSPSSTRWSRPARAVGRRFTSSSTSTGPLAVALALWRSVATALTVASPPATPSIVRTLPFKLTVATVGLVDFASLYLSRSSGSSSLHSLARSTATLLPSSTV